MRDALRALLARLAARLGAALRGDARAQTAAALDEIQWGSHAR